MSLENNYSNSDIIPCFHEPKNIFKLKSHISICFGCSSIIYLNKSGNIILPVKPQKYNASQETATPFFLSLHDTHCPLRFCNKDSYLEIRTKIVKKMKLFSQKMGLSLTTYFLALDYFDRLCSRLTEFNFSVVQIAQFCVVLAAKFQDEQQNVINAKLSLGYSKNYSTDELYILQLLNYELYSITSYDIVKDFMYTGFLFNNEKFSRNKMHIIYGKIEKILYFFSETKYYIEMTQMEIALAVIGFVRETLGLTAYNNILKDLFMPLEDYKRYLHCLAKFKKYFKIQDDTNHHHNDNNEQTNKNININNDFNQENSAYSNYESKSGNNNDVTEHSYNNCKIIKS